MARLFYTARERRISYTSTILPRPGRSVPTLFFAHRVPPDDAFVRPRDAQSGAQLAPMHMHCTLDIESQSELINE